MRIRHILIAAVITFAATYTFTGTVSAQPLSGAGALPAQATSQGGHLAPTPVYHRRWRRRHYGYGPGIYFSYPYYAPYYAPYYYYPRRRYHRPRYRRRAGRCGYWRERCIANWGYRNPDYRGCMRYHGC